MPASTTRLSLPYPLGGEAANLGAADFQALADALDTIIPPTSSGPYGSRPPSTVASPGIVDRHYYATDIGLAFRDTGTSWVPEGIPIGGYLAWAGDGDLTPELVRADGRLIDKTTYASFFTMFGHRFNGGVDPGSNHVKIPDALGRTVIGAGTGTGLTARTVGQLVGEETHALSTAEIGFGANTSVEAFTTNPSARPVPPVAAIAHNNVQPSAVATILVRII